MLWPRRFAPVRAGSRRFAEQGLTGLAELAGKPPPRTTVTDEVCDEVLAATLTRPPPELGITHWSSRLLAEWLGTAAPAWNAGFA